MGIDTVSHCFPLNGKPENAEIAGGIAAVVNIYRDTISQIGLSFPTLFEPLLIEFKNYVTSLKDSRK